MNINISIIEFKYGSYTEDIIIQVVSTGTQAEGSLKQKYNANYLFV